MKMTLKRTAEMARTKAPEADLRIEYRKTFWACFGASSVVLVMVILFWPSFEASAYAKPQEPVIIQLEEIPETRQERRPPPPPRPVVPIASTDEEIPEDATIMETDLDFGLDDLAPPPPLEELKARTEVALEEEEEEIVEYWRVEKPPKSKNGPKPEYPQIARRAGITGNVTIQVLVDREGKAERVGEIQGNEVFHDAVRKAAMATIFTPAIQNDKPVKVWVALTYKFQF